MKKIYLSLFILAAGFSANAQLTQTNHAPAAGDMYDMYQCDSLGINPGASGANASWNFSAISTHSNIVKSYTAQAVTTTTYPAANVAVASGGGDIEYLASSSSSLSYYGGNIAVGLVNGSITYTSPAIYASYPMSLNSTATAPVGGTLYVSSLSASGSFSGTSKTIVDGSGTLTLPGSATYTDVFRVVTSQSITASASFATATVTLMSYNYYSTSQKGPLFTIATSTAVVATIGPASTTTQTLVTRNKNAPGTPTVTGIFEQAVQEAFNFQVYPNPSSSFVNFTTENQGAKTLMVYDVTGKLVDKQSFTEGKIKLDVSSYNKGLYIYTVIGVNEQKLKTGKITVSQN